MLFVEQERRLSRRMRQPAAQCYSHPKDWLIAERVPASTALGVHYTRSRELRDTQQRAGYQLTGDELEPQLRAALICADDAGDAGVKRPWSSASLNQGNAPAFEHQLPEVGVGRWVDQSGLGRAGRGRVDEEQVCDDPGYESD
ncbi:hypothetical protein B0H14DRAFT_2650202 [Mycena olivaceomarginata]|nr:hypothetical protein B0H14DRAFT_2650202 [Mycena olivaceomarginata]